MRVSTKRAEVELSYPAQTIVKQLHNQRGGQLGPLSGERDVTGNWSLKPVNDPNRLAAMRCACQIALGMTDQNHPDDFDRLKVFLRKNYKNYNGNPIEVIPSGWIDRGTKWEAPKHWPYVANCGHEYVWVKPDRLRDFTNFALIYLDIATITAGPRRDLPDAVKKPQTRNAVRSLALTKELDDAKQQYIGAEKRVQEKRNALNSLLLNRKERDAANRLGQARDDELLESPRNLDLTSREQESLTDLRRAIKDRNTALDGVDKKISELMKEQEGRVLEAEAADAAVKAVQCQELNEMPGRTDDVQTINPGLFFIPR